jgi:hypothetical protein
MVKRAAPKARKRPRNADDAVEEEGGAGFFLLDDDDQQKQQQSEEEDEEQQETAEQKRIRLGELDRVSKQLLRLRISHCNPSRGYRGVKRQAWLWQHLQQQPCCC